jgi:hypothetical protein
MRGLRRPLLLATFFATCAALLCNMRAMDEKSSSPDPLARAPPFPPARPDTQGDNPPALVLAARSPLRLSWPVALFCNLRSPSFINFVHAEKLCLFRVLPRQVRRGRVGGCVCQPFEVGA